MTKFITIALNNGDKMSTLRQISSDGFKGLTKMLPESLTQLGWKKASLISVAFFCAAVGLIWFARSRLQGRAMTYDLQTITPAQLGFSKKFLNQKRDGITFGTAATELLDTIKQGVSSANPSNSFLVEFSRTDQNSPFVKYLQFGLNAGEEFNVQQASHDKNLETKSLILATLKQLLERRVISGYTESSSCFTVWYKDPSR
jgi:hypothetical protein